MRKPIGKKISKILAVVLIISTMTGITAFADDVNSAKSNQDKAKAELDKAQNDMTYLLSQMSNLEIKMSEANDSMEAVTVELVAAQETQNQQYKDMKLRIKYMYEDQEATVMETLLTSESMSEVLNKAEYMQQVYDYDRTKLDEMAVTAKTIADKKAAIAIELNHIASMQADMSAKQELLYTTIAELESKYTDFATVYKAAVDAATKKAAAEAAAAAAATAVPAKAPTGNATVGQAIASLAYNYIGTPYRSGGSSPGGFDCSGFTKFLFAQYGYSLSPSSSAQAGGGTRVASLSDALPGDIICYAGHVALYIGGGQIIHASVPGDYVKIAPAGIMTIQSIRRYW